MTPLLETTAAMAVTGGVVALLTGTIAASARVDAAAASISDRLFQQRQLEHLIDRATAAAGAGPTYPPAVSSVREEDVVFSSDRDGDGSVDPRSSETTTLEVRQVGAQSRVRLRLGGQTMTVLTVPQADVALSARSREGSVANASNASVIELSVVDRDDATDHADDRRYLFSVPDRLWP